jgi:ABC-2 type transport system permease protein
MGTDRSLEIRGISKRYGETVALQDLSFEVRAGELFGFVGRNGAGKTTTMRIVALTHVASIPGLSVVSILGDLVWFLLGFLFYATAYASVAALVSRQEEVSGAIAPISLLLVGGYLLVFVTLPDPGSMRSTILSLLPPFAPVLMSIRMATGDVPVWQVGLAMALTLASILGLTWLAGRIYANAALRLGARVSFRDALRG